MAANGAAAMVPTSSNLRMSVERRAGAAVSGQVGSIRSRLTYRKPVLCGASSHLCRLVP
jgi:predicted fused transcriptional regulator/phosphomethylpyrimidine kinase